MSEEKKVDEDPVGEGKDDAREERGPPRADRLQADLVDGLDELGRLARGLAGKVAGPRVDQERDPEEPVVSPEVDETIAGLGNTLGHWLRAAGEAMNEHPDKPGVVLDEALERGREEPIEEQADEEGWSPLVQGARVFSTGLGQVTSSLLDSLVADTGRRRRPRAAEEE
jgi:hypothetical protein